MPRPPTANVTCDASSTPGVRLHDRPVLLDGEAARRVQTLALHPPPGDDAFELVLQLLCLGILDVERREAERGEGQQSAVGADADAGHAEGGERHGGVNSATETGNRALDH